MATTIVPNPGTIDPNLDSEEVLKQVHEWLLEAQGDLDKAGDPDDANYYAGLVDAYTSVERLLVGTREKIANVEEWLAIAGKAARYPNEADETELPRGWSLGEDDSTFVVVPITDFAWVNLHSPSGEAWRDHWREVIRNARDDQKYDNDLYGGYPPPVLVNPRSIAATIQDSVKADAITWYCEHTDAVGQTILYDRDGWYGNTSPLAIRMPNGDLVLVEGNHRWIGSLLLGRTQMPVQIIDSPIDLREV